MLINKISLLLLLLPFVLCYNVNKPMIKLNNNLLNKITKTVITTGLTIGLFHSNLYINNEFNSNIVHADSTGKFSTKLTARKRYLPRIIKAIPLFNDFQSKQSDSDITSYIKSEQFNDLVRALKLYGASLKKGELPDDTSRTTEKLSIDFENDCINYSKSPNKEKLLLCLDDFNKYVEFAGIENK